MKFFTTVFCALRHSPEWQPIGATSRRTIYHCWACRTFRSWPKGRP